MAIPAFRQRPAGGWINESQQAANALTKQNIENKYLPMTKQSEAASKLAYANLMGPQFLAKLMGNPDVVGNSPQLQDPSTLARLYQAGMGQGTGNALVNMPGYPSQDNNSFSGWLTNKIKTLLSGNTQQPQPQNALAYGSPNAGGQGNGADSGYGYDKNGNNLVASPQEIANVAGGNNAAQLPAGEMEAAMQAWLQSPEAKAKAQQDGMMTIPNQPELLQWYRNKQGIPGVTENSPQAPVASPPQGKTYAEKAGAFKGEIAQGEEAGRIRARAVDEMDKQYQQAVQAEVPVKHLIDMTQSPVFQKMRSDVPLFQDKQLKVLAKIGTPEEQKAVGDFISTTANAVANTVQGFGGRALDKEFGLAERMKISDNDTWNVMLGKLGSIATFNEMTKQRSRIASKIMDKEHLSRGDALEKADKQVDGDKIRKLVEQKINPKPTKEDIDHMSNKYGITKEEVIKRLKAKGIL